MRDRSNAAFSRPPMTAARMTRPTLSWPTLKPIRPHKETTAMLMILFLTLAALGGFLPGYVWGWQRSAVATRARIRAYAEVYKEKQRLEAIAEAEARRLARFAIAVGRWR